MKELHRSSGGAPSRAQDEAPPVDLTRQRVGGRGALVAAAANAVWTFERFLSANSRHISGRDVEAAVAAARTEAGRGRWLTLGYWSQMGEAPAGVSARYMEGVEAIAASGLSASLSIKVDTLGFRRDLLGPLFDKARAGGVRLHFDSQAWDTASESFALLDEARSAGVEVSASITARWRRSLVDAERMVALGVPVRIAKGQGGDPGARGLDPRKAFLDLVRHCARRDARVGVATHDRRVAEPALDILAEAGADGCLEQLTSLPRLDFLAERRGLPVRVYIAYGAVGLPYAVTEVFRRPAIVGWMLRDFVEKFRPQ